MKIHAIRTWGLTKRKGMEEEQSEKKQWFDEDIASRFPNMANYGAALYEDRVKVSSLPSSCTAMYSL